MEKLYNLGGINWCWFLGYILHDDNTVTVTYHGRLHKGDKWPEKFEKAPYHPKYYGEQQIREGVNRQMIEVFDPEKGWCKVRNVKGVFDY